MNQVFVGVGSNEGNRLANISSAIEVLNCTSGIRVVRMALIRETEPVGGPPQGPYLNTVVELETSLPPSALLSALKETEVQLKRLPTSERFGPRPIDLDILIYDECVINEPGLVIPHSRMHERQFVLEPLSQIAPDIRHPILGETFTTLLKRLACQAPAGMASETPK